MALQWLYNSSITALQTALQRPYKQLCNDSTIAYIVVYKNLKVLRKVLLKALYKTLLCIKLYSAADSSSISSKQAAVGAVRVVGAVDKQ